MNAGGRVHRASRSAVLVLLATAGIALVMAVGTAAGAERPARGSITLVVPDRFEGGDTVRVLVGTEIERPVAARVCNTDAQIPRSGACGRTYAPTRDRVFDIPVHTGVVGADPRAVCPAISPTNGPDSMCTIMLSTASGTEFAAADVVVADPSGELDQRITVEVHGQSPPVTSGSTVPTTTTTVAPPATTVGLPPVSEEPIAGAAALQTGGGPPAGDSPPDGGSSGAPLATTGPADAIPLTLLGIALLDLGWLMWSSARTPRVRVAHVAP